MKIRKVVPHADLTKAEVRAYKRAAKHKVRQELRQYSEAE